MITPSTQPASRYRRRILGLGVLATGALYVIGAPIFNNRIESDLESRVPTELATNGFTGLTASFSGQDGTLNCDAPLDDPEGARAAAYDVRGVRAIELDRSCRVNTSPGAVVEETPDETTADGSSGQAVTDETEPSVTTSTLPVTESTVTNPDADLATIHDVVAANPDLAFLAVLLADTDIGRSEEPVTLFAPSNAAFDAVPADVLSRVQNDRDVLNEVLGHHVVEGVYTSADLVDGDLMASDGAALAVSVGDEITVGGATLIETDIVASNGVVHVVDSVLVPAGVLEPADVQAAPVAVTYDGERMVLMGTVASEVERRAIIAAAVEAVGIDFVVDEMTVDPDAGVAAATAAGVAELVRAMPANLLSGESGFNGTELYATGVAASADAREAFGVVAATVDVEASLTDPPDATDADATDLQAQLNAFVADNPILFEPSSAVLAESAVAVIDQLAADALGFDGIEITVEGHTDSDGVSIENQQLSQNRAETVRVALIARGLPAEAVTAEGFGSERPILVDGDEDKSASRRVEFRVVATS